MESTKKKYSMSNALIMLGLAIITIIAGKLYFSLNTTLVLLISTLVTAAFGVLTRVPWNDIQGAIVSGFGTIAVPVIMLMEIGLLVGAWMVSGTIPAMMYYGLKLINPGFFLVSACLLCTVISILAGTSYGTVSTIGVALAGIAAGLDIPLAATAGAIVAGAWFGDTMSPLSDSTVMVSNACKIPLMSHIRNNLYTTIPAYVISLIYFMIIGMNYGGGAVSGGETEIIMSVLKDNFVISPLMLIPPAVVFVLILMKKPTLPVFAAGIIVAVILAIFVQHNDFAAVMGMIVSGFSGDTGNELVNTLVHRGGMESMMSTVSLVIASAAFSAPLRASGCVETILGKMEEVVKSGKQLMLITTILHPILFIVSVTYYVSYTLLGEMMSPVYEKYDLSRRNLSRIMSDTGVSLAALIPWGAAGALVHSQIGVSAWEYARYAPFNCLCLVFGVIYIFTGIGIENKDGTKQRPLFRKTAGKEEEDGKI